jgi:hypothetical protein
MQVAKAHCAEFLGYCEVSSDEATSRLTQGLWLVSAGAGATLDLQQHVAPRLPLTLPLCCALSTDVEV